MNNFKTALVSLTLIATTSWLLAQEHLEPETGFIPQFGDYHKNVQQVLAPAFGKDVFFRIQVYPSFQPEWIIGFKKYEGVTRLFFTVPMQQVWGTEIQKMNKSGAIRQISGDGSVDDDIENLKKEYPQGASGIKIEYYSVKLEEALATRIGKLMERIVVDARKPEGQTMGLDGNGT